MNVCICVSVFLWVLYLEILHLEEVIKVDELKETKEFDAAGKYDK